MSSTRYQRFCSWHFGLCSSHTLGRRCLLLGILRPIHDPKGTAVNTAMVTVIEHCGKVQDVRLGETQ